MASQMLQSLSVILLAACSGMLRPVVTRLPVLVAVYAMPIGPAHAVNIQLTTTASWALVSISLDIFIITSSITPSSSLVKSGPVLT